jgi:hypothetical protein
MQRIGPAIGPAESTSTALVVFTAVISITLVVFAALIA